MSDPSLDRLLCHAEFVRAVARGILRDRHLAEDVVQDTMLAALRRPPRDEGRIRAWLGKVAANRARSKLRARARRAARERAAAQPDRSRDLVEELELQRAVAGAVLELAEPLRSTLLRRYFEGLTFREIGARDGVDPETARQRHERALAKLRKRFAPALAALALFARPSSAALVGGLVVSTKTKLAAVAAVLLLAGVAGVWTWRAGAADAPARTTGERVADAPAPPKGTVAPAPAQVAVAGRVVDAAGRPVAGAHVGAWRDPGTFQGPNDLRFLARLDGARIASTRSAADGTFELDIAPRAVVLGAWTASAVAGRLPRLDARGGVRGVVLRLERATTQRGRVVDARGEPVPGATVRLVPTWRMPVRFPTSDTVLTTDRDGGFALPPAPGGRYLLLVRHRAYPPLLRSVVLPQAAVDVVLGDGVSLEGRTTPPAPGAIVTVGGVAAGTLPAFTTTTGPDGTFETGPVPPSVPLNVVVDAGASGRGYAWSVEAGGDPVVVDMLPVEVVEGRVHDVDTGAPVAGLRLFHGARGVLATGPDGGFSFHRDPVATDNVTVAPGQAYVQVSGTVAHAEARLDIAVAKTVAVTGRVVDADGRPVEGATVGGASSGHTDPAVFAGGAVTGADGRFRLRGFAPRARNPEVHARKSGYLATVAPVADGPVEIVLRRGARVTGRVVDPAGDPVPGAWINLNIGTGIYGGTRYPTHYLEPVHADADGRFRYAAVPPGKRFLMVHARGFRRPEHRTVRIGTEPLDLGAIVLERGLTLRGRVVDVDGRPVANAQVSVGSGGPSWGAAVTGADGGFEIAGLAAGPHQIYCGTLLHLQDPNPSPVTLPVDGVHEVRVKRRTVGTVSIAGTVVDLAGRPVVGATVRAGPNETFGGRMWTAPRTGVDGRFEAKGLTAGRYFLHVNAPELVFDPVPAETGAANVLVRPVETVSVAGRVVDRAGEPRPGVAVRVFGEQPEGRKRSERRSGVPMATTDGAGRFRFKHLFGDTFTLLAPGAPPVRAVPAGAEAVAIVAGTGLTVRGTVRDGAGAPVARASVEVELLREPEYRAQVVARADGTFVVEGLAAGPIRLRSGDEWVEVPAGSDGVTLRAEK